MQVLFIALIFPTAIDNNNPQYIFQYCMVFMTLDMLFITGAAYGTFLLDQNYFKVSEAILKVSELCPVNTSITGSTDTLVIALTNLSYPTACNHLLCSMEPTMTLQINFNFLSFN